jgi:hypothetical protein
VAVLAITVIVPELVVEREAEVAWIVAVPVTCPVKTALLLSPPATRSSFTTPPVLSSRDHAVAATLSTKLSEASRVIAYTVSELPCVTLWDDTTVPLPLANVSTRIFEAVPAVILNVEEVETVNAGLLVAPNV